MVSRDIKKPTHVHLLKRVGDIVPGVVVWPCLNELVLLKGLTSSLVALNAVSYIHTRRIPDPIKRCSKVMGYFLSSYITATCFQNVF